MSERDDLPDLPSLRVRTPPPGGLVLLRARIDRAHRRRLAWVGGTMALTAAAVVVAVVAARAPAPSPTPTITAVAAPAGTLDGTAVLAPGAAASFLWVASRPAAASSPPPAPERAPALAPIGLGGEPPAGAPPLFLTP